MSKKSTDNIQVGDLVLVRPRLVIPSRPWCIQQFASPYFFPGEVTEIITRDGAGIVVMLQDHRYGQLWGREQAFTTDEVHYRDCGCAECDEGSEPRIDELQAMRLPGVEDGDVAIMYRARVPGEVVVWVGHPLTVDQIAEVMAYELSETLQPIPGDLCMDQARGLLAGALAFHGLANIKDLYIDPPEATMDWAKEQAARLFGDAS